MRPALLLLLAGCAGEIDRSRLPDGHGVRGQAPDQAGLPVDGTGPAVLLDVDDSCANPCTFAAVATSGVAWVSYEADGWSLGSSNADDFALRYHFNTLGDREITANAHNAAGTLVATDTRWVEVHEEETSDDTHDERDDSQGCESYDSSEEEYAPVQTAGSGFPSGASGLDWLRPSSYTYLVAFSGTPGCAATHEGVDYVHSDSTVTSVPVYAAAAGEVVYVRLGCPQSSTFAHNTASRECGAGWGNHVVVDHGGGVMTRYAHLDPDDLRVRVGDQVTEWTVLGGMGNSGRSELRHLHFELGGHGAALDPCAPAQSFDAVYDSGGLF